MKWHSNRIKKLLRIYALTQYNLADFLGFSRQTIAHKLNEGYDFEPYSEQLTAFFKAKSEGKIKEYQALINFYEKAI